jgi:hypothetical protein
MIGGKRSILAGLLICSAECPPLGGLELRCIVCDWAVAFVSSIPISIGALFLMPVSVVALRIMKLAR